MNLLNTTLQGKIVAIHGFKPGATGASFILVPSKFQESDGEGNFKTENWSFYADCWREGADGRLYGLYTDSINSLPGMVCIEVVADDAERASDLVALLKPCLKRKRSDGRYDTAEGDKTALGLYRTLKRFFKR